MENEFESLSDIVLGRGVKHSEIISLIHNAVLKDYALHYPEAPKDASVIVDEKTGNVRIISGGADVTPKEYSPIGARIARQVVLQKLIETEGRSLDLSQAADGGEKAKQPSLGIGILGWLAYIYFWAYHGLFLSAFAIYSFNVIFNSTFRAGLLEDFQVYKLPFLLAFLAMPFLSVWIARKTKIDKDPFRLGKLFLLYELPLTFILLVTLFSFQYATPAMWFFAAMAIFTIAVSFLDFVNVKVATLRHKMAVMVLQESALITTGYLTLLYMFYLPLLIGEFMYPVFQFLTEGDDINILSLIGLLIVFLLYLVPLIIFSTVLVSPFLICHYLYKTFRLTHEDIAKRTGGKKAIYASALVLALYFMTLFAISYQPDISSDIEKLENMSSTQTFEEKEAIVKEIAPREGRIKKAFDEMQTGRRYYLAAKTDHKLKDAYMQTFQFNEAMAGVIQDAFLGLAYPFVYQGTYDSRGEAWRNYQIIFPRKSESKPVNNVNLASREVRVQTDYENLLATISVQEEYKNTAYTDQEVVYEFSLPNDSVITDLKLGPDLEFDGAIAPRGAAGKVYQQEVARRRDPALLEQTGPRQYRLRIFPIPGQNDRTTLKGKNQKVKFSYVAAVTGQGYPLPVYTKTKNIKIDEDNISFYLNSKSVNPGKKASFVSGSSLSNVSNLCGLSSTETLRTAQEDDSFSARLIPYRNAKELEGSYVCDKNKGVNLVKSLKRSNIAILYDASFANKDNRLLDELKELLRTEPTLVQNNRIDLYLFNSDLSEPRPISGNWKKELSGVTYFGKSDWISALTTVADKKKYGLIIVATSGDDIETRQSGIKINTGAPLYVIHSGDKAPSYPIKLTNAILQSGGGVSSGFSDALTQYAVKAQLKTKNYSGHYYLSAPYWSYEVSRSTQNYSVPEASLMDIKIKTHPDDPLSYLIAKGQVSYLVGTYYYLADLESDVLRLDSINSVATNAHVVTPYSSLIALVNETQKSNLNAETESQDRYDYKSTEENTSWKETGGNFYFNPISSSRFDAPSSPSGGRRISTWGAVSRPMNAPNDVRTAAFSLVWWFVSLNVIIIAFGAFVTLAGKLRQKSAAKKK